jgi:hypothetical protein
MGFKIPNFFKWFRQMRSMDTVPPSMSNLPYDQPPRVRSMDTNSLTTMVDENFDEEQPNPNSDLENFDTTTNPETQEEYIQ